MSSYSINFNFSCSSSQCDSSNNTLALEFQDPASDVSDMHSQSFEYSTLPNASVGEHFGANLQNEFGDLNPNQLDQPRNDYCQWNGDPDQSSNSNFYQQGSDSYQQSGDSSHFALITNNSNEFCTGAEVDGETFETLLGSSGYETTHLSGEEASQENILSELAAAADKLQPGDTFVFTYSGHGSDMPDANGDEADGKDEYLALGPNENELLVDDEIWAALQDFKPGVNVGVVFDTCNSGTGISGPGEMDANVVYIGGSQDGAFSYGDNSGGVLTNAIGEAMDSGSDLTYQQLFEAVDSTVQSAGDGQDPQLQTYGPGGEALLNTQAFG